jgi:hypothetical protein
MNTELEMILRKKFRRQFATSNLDKPLDIKKSARSVQVKYLMMKDE